MFPRYEVVTMDTDLNVSSEQSAEMQPSMGKVWSSGRCDIYYTVVTGRGG